MHVKLLSEKVFSTRSAFLAGHYPFHMGTQSDTFFWMEPSGVPIEFRFFPQDLQQAGYSTYLVGKLVFGLLLL